jgi:outer membrane protein TolC
MMSMKYIRIILMGLIVPVLMSAQRKVRLDLNRTIEMAAKNSLSAFRYQNLYLTGYWEYRTYRANRLPSLTLDITPARYYRYITQRYDSENNLDVYREQQMFSASGSMNIKQNLDITGGTFYIDSELDFMRNFGDTRSTQYSTIPVRIGYQQSLLGYNAFKWDRKIEPLKFEKAKRQLLYNMESVSENAVTCFFNLAMAQADMKLAKENVSSSDTLYALGLQRHKIAAISQADLLTLKLDKVNAHNTLENARIALKRAMFSLASFLDLDKNTEIELDIPAHLPGKMISVDDALLRAKENNPTYLEQRQNILEAEQTVDRTKKESHFDASFNASIGFNQVADKIGNAYRNPLQQDLVSVSVSIPLIDWGVRKGKHNMARNNLNVIRTTARQEELSVEEDVVMTVNDFNVQQNLIGSAEEALDIAITAYDQTRQRFIIGKADINSLTLSLNRQQEAQKNYISSLKNYWLSYYKIRRLTLHDFESGFSLSDKFVFNHGISR